MTLADVQAAVDAWVKATPRGYWTPLANLARLTEEVGELAREINHRFGPKPRKDSEDDASLALEIADVLFVLVALANEQEVDLDAAFRATLEKYRSRDADRWRAADAD